MNAQPPQQPHQQPHNPYAAPISPQYQQPMGFGADMGMQQPLAGLGARFAGALVDGLAMMALAIPGFIMLASANGSPDEAVMLLGIGAPILVVTIVQWYLIATSGQSIGKKLLGTKIIKMDGSDVDFVSGVILRSWVTGALAQIPIAGGIIGLVDALMIFGDERRTLHDRIAGTQVIALP